MYRAEWVCGGSGSLKINIPLYPPASASSATSSAGVMFPDGLLEEVLGHLDGLAPALDGDHPLVVVVSVPQGDVGPALGPDPADPLAPGSEDGPGHGLVYGHLLLLLLTLVASKSIRSSSTSAD